MLALNQVIDYLHTKVGKININNEARANTGGFLIKTSEGWEEHIEAMVIKAMQIIQSQFTRKHVDYLPGEAALTSTSMTIGKHIAPIIRREPIDLKHQLALGDLLIEGFVYHGFINLQSPKKRHESYKLIAAPKWEELCELSREMIKHVIVGSFPTPLPPASKNIHKTHSQLFNEDTAYVRAVDKLQSVAWSVNRKVYDTVVNNPTLFISNIPEDNDAKEQKRRSKLIEWKFITQKAEVLKEYDEFYQAFEVDYRGRMYNVEPFLNFQGNDLAKGLLQFSNPKPMDESGRFWLAVYTATNYNETYHIDSIPSWCEENYQAFLLEEGLEDISVDKMTLNDRAMWTIKNYDTIMKWADEDTIRIEAEKPVIFLACCYEWHMIDGMDEKGETPLSCLPVGIDGSNNGWQHLAAISKDCATGNLVGLTPTTIQNDFYVQTAKELINLTTDERLSSILSSMPMKHIRKGISKRGSMTRAYSAGARKIGENMFFDCKAEDYHEKYGITEADCYKLASALVKAIEIVCPGPLETMDYLQKLAAYKIGKHSLVGPGDMKNHKSLKKRRKELLYKEDLTDEELNELDDISKELLLYSYELSYGEGEEAIEWSTPSGFHTRYEKYIMTDFGQRATLNGRQINHSLKTPTDRPDVRGFMCGISPNYIHSMDAAHMALVIDGWEGDFGAVHDSFSTHASDVDNLLDKTKRVFIDMYDHDNVFNIIRNNLTEGKDDVIQPSLGSLNIGDINDSDFFFA